MKKIYNLNYVPYSVQQPSPPSEVKAVSGKEGEMLELLGMDGLEFNKGKARQNSNE